MCAKYTFLYHKRVGEIKSMSQKYVLAIDQSTQSTKAMLFDEKGNITCREDRQHQQLINNKGYVSHDLHEIWENLKEAVKTLLKENSIDENDIACIGISNQRETACAFDRLTGEPLTEAVVWQCTRAVSVCDRIEKNVIFDPEREENGETTPSQIILSKTGLRLSPYFSAAKFAWMLENEKKVQEAKRLGRLLFGTVDTYLVYRMTHGKIFATDYSNASRTQLFNIHTLSWDKELCRWFGIQPDHLPEVKDSSGNFGTTTLDGVFSREIPICSVIGDSQAALFGQGCTRKGMVKASYGTGSSVMMNVGPKLQMQSDKLNTSIAWGLNGKIIYALEGNVNYSAAVISWLKNDLKLISDPRETELLARQANNEDVSYIVPAFTGLSTPYWNSNAKAVISGMTRLTGKNEMVRAALESIAYQIEDVIHEMLDETHCELRELHAGGAPSSNAYLMQFQADILNTNVLVDGMEASAKGAALMAGLFPGFYHDIKALGPEDTRIYKPVISPVERRRKLKGWGKAIHMALM